MVSTLGLVALGGAAAATTVDDPVSQSGGVEEPTTVNSTVMNYAVNLDENATASQFGSAVAAIEGLNGVVLERYPEINAFFVQSQSKSFVADMELKAQEEGLPLHSVGPTRTAPVTGEENVVGASGGNSMSTHSSGSAAVSSQLDDFTEDPLTHYAWGLAAIGAVEAQKVDVFQAPVVVGVLDTGIDGDHPDLVAQIDETKSVGCAVNGVPDPSRSAWQDVHTHGTHVAGTIAASHNGAGIDGIAPKATLAAVRVSNAEGLFYPEYVTCGMKWAVDHQFDVTNNSYYVDPWAYWIPTEPTQKAGYEVVRRIFAYADAAGVVNVVAAGNANTDIDAPTTDSESPNDGGMDPIADRDVSTGIDIPAMLPDVVTVSAVARPSPETQDPSTEVLVRSSFSNYGKQGVEIAAPGTMIASTMPGGQYGYSSGTSMASPHVAGVAALIKSVHPEAHSSEVKDLLYKQAASSYDRLAVPNDGKEYRGYGLVNALAALLKDQPKPTVAAIEYSVDSTTWMPVDGATINVAQYPHVKFRVRLTGPVSQATVSVNGEKQAEGTVADKGFNSELVVESGAIDVNSLFATGETSAQMSMGIDARGLNNDKRADDDITVSSAFTLMREVKQTPVAPTEKVSDSSEKQPEKPVTSGVVSKDEQTTPTRPLAMTGADTYIPAVAALVFTAGLVMAARRRFSQ